MTEVIDESVEKWRRELEGDKDDPRANPPDDQRRVIFEEFSVHVSDGKVYTYDLTTKEGLAKCAKEAYILHEGDTFHYELKFRVHHELVLGLKMKTKAKKLLNSQEEEFEIGSFPPKVDQLTKVMIDCEVPTGFLARGKYDVVNTIINGKGENLFSFDSKFEIVKA